MNNFQGALLHLPFCSGIDLVSTPTGPWQWKCGCPRKEVDTPSGTASDAEIDKRSKVLADPTDFSRPPTLPQLAKLDSERLEAAIQNGIQYMVAKQNSNGSWGSPTRTKSLNIYAPVPGRSSRLPSSNNVAGDLSTDRIRVRSTLRSASYR